MKVPRKNPVDYSPSLRDTRSGKAFPEAMEDDLDDALEVSPGEEGAESAESLTVRAAEHANALPEVRFFDLPAECSGLRLDQALARLMPQHSRNRLQGWLREGRVLLNGRSGVDAKHKVWQADRIELLGEPVDPRAQVAQAEAIPLAIVHEDEDILILDKPAGLVVHPGSGNWQGTLLNALLHHDPRLAALPRAGIVHRLDKETTGLMVVAKTLTAQTDLVRQLEARTVRRHYLALAFGRLNEGGCVDAPIGRHPTQRTRMAVVLVERHGRPARTHYTLREQFPCMGLTLLECRLETGRTHQIRVHLSSIGHPLVGDPVYGRKPNPARMPALLAAFPRQALHAWQLALRHPARQEEMAWTAGLPDDFSTLLQEIRRLEEKK